MPTGKITKRAVDSLSPGEKDILLWDEDLRGFGVKVTPTGSKIYLVQYRLGGRGVSTKRYTIRRHGAWTPSAARQEAERVLRLADTGVDPQAKAVEHQQIEIDLRFEAYAERFLLDFGKRNWRPRTYASAESNLRRWITPTLKSKALPEISRREIRALFEKLPAASPALPRNLYALLRKLFAWAVENEDLERSPFEQMQSPKSVAPRERVLTDNELKEIIMCLGDLGPPFDRMFRLLMITGQRRDEVSGMNWVELNRSHAEWTIPGDRTKNAKVHIVPLNTNAIAELDSLAGGVIWPHQGFVFSTNGRTPVSGYSRAKARLDRILSCRTPIAILPWRLHDFRRTFATNMQRLNVRFEVTEALLNHVSGSKSGVAGVYQRHDWKLEKQNAMERWAGKLAALIATGDTKSECGDAGDTPADL